MTSIILCRLLEVGKPETLSFKILKRGLIRYSRVTYRGSECDTTPKKNRDSSTQLERCMNAWHACLTDGNLLQSQTTR